VALGSEEMELSQRGEGAAGGLQDESIELVEKIVMVETYM